MSAVTKQADSGFGSIELSLPRRESALCNTKSLALCAGQREGHGTQPDSDAIRFDVSVGSIASFWSSADHFRFTPISRHSQYPSACLKGATNGHGASTQTAVA